MMQSTSSRSFFLGSVFVFFSSLGFGAMALFARAAYDFGVTPASLLFFRFLIAALVMGGLSWVRKVPCPRGKTFVGLALMGGLGYTLQSFSCFTALTMADVGLVSLLLFTYPAIVAVFHWIFFRERLRPIQGLAVGVSIRGTASILGPSPAGTFPGILLGLNAALVYSFYIMAGTYLLKEVPVVSSSTVIMGSAALAFGSMGAIVGFSFPSQPLGWLPILAVALVSTVMAVTFFLVGIQYLGPTRASVLSTFEPIFTILLAAVFLHEPLGWGLALGGGCIVGAGILLARGNQTDPPG